MKKDTILFLSVALLFSCERLVKPPVKQIGIAGIDTLSIRGSTRATSYDMSNKIIQADGKIFVCWLDHPSDIQIRAFDTQKERWSDSVLLGQGTDNHGGPALTRDSRGTLYAVYGPHHGSFQISRSRQPFSIAEWEKLPDFGDTATYPSLICDPQDRLHLTYRGLEQPWKLTYQCRAQDGEWSAPRALVSAAVDSGYTQFGNPLAISADGSLHLAFHIYDQQPPGGKAVGYLCSRDGGETWQNSDAQVLGLPVKPDSPCMIETGSGLDMRVNALVVDPDGNPWVMVSHLETKPRKVLLWHRQRNCWQKIDLLPVVQSFLPDVEVLYGGLTFSRDNMLYVTTTIQPIGTERFWGGEKLETILLVSADGGRSFRCLPISDPSDGVPNWQPSIERPYSGQPIAMPTLLYTAGKVGQGVNDSTVTQVVFVRLAWTDGPTESESQIMPNNREVANQGTVYGR